MSAPATKHRLLPHTARSRLGLRRFLQCIETHGDTHAPVSSAHVYLYLCTLYICLALLMIVCFST